MSTNYYLRNKKEYVNHLRIMQERNEIIKKILKQLQEWNASDDELYDIQFRIESIAQVGYEEIHIGKRSLGWKPLFQKNEHFSSVKELEQFYKKNQDTYEIIDEYNRVLTWDELKKELIDWKGEREHEGDIYKDDEGYEWARFEFS